MTIASWLVLAAACAGCGGSSARSPDATAPADTISDAIHVDAPPDAPSGPAYQQAYLKSPTALQNDWFGFSVTISADGNTLAVSKQPDDTSAAVYIFTRTGSTWTQQAEIPTPGALGDDFGYSVSLSADGTLIAIGAIFTASDAGAVYVYAQSAGAWTLQATLAASNPDANDEFGYNVALSPDGMTLAVGATQESSAAKGIGGNQADNSASNAGAAYVFVRAGATWTQQAYLKASNTAAGAMFGYSVALSSDGSTLAVGALLESGGSTGIDGDQANQTAPLSGAVYVFTRAATTWTQQAYVKASNTAAYTGSGDFGYEFGGSVALSTDGDTLVVGSPNEESDAKGVDGNQTDASDEGAGAAYVFGRTGTTWTQQAYLKASNTRSGEAFAQALAVSGDGNTLVIGGRGDASLSGGIDGSQTGTAAGAGAAFLFERTGTTWAQAAYVKPADPFAQENFGNAVAMSSGGTFVVGAWLESSDATGVNGDETDTRAFQAGAAFVFQIP